MTEYYLWLLQLMGPANPESHAVLQTYGSAKEAYTAIKEKGDTSLLTPAAKKRLETATLENAELILRHCKKKNIRIAVLDGEDYPYRLRNIYNPPIVLFYKGTLKGLDNEICVGGVGARDATEYTAKLTRRTCVDLARLGVVLVSGMAVGVDNIVHNAAIECNAKTIGVLACGLDIDYPRGSLSTRERICECGGAVISELMPFDKASKTYFNTRNRLIAGLSLGVMVFQAGMSSGSLLTANHALQQGRDVFCVPPADVFSPTYSGVVSYLRDGAIPLFNYLDVVNAYFASFSEKLAVINRQNKFSIQPEKHFVFVKNEEKKSEKKKAEQKNVEASSQKKTQKELDLSNYSEEHKAVLQSLMQAPKNIEQITAATGISPDNLAEILVDLEIEGVLRATPGANYELI